MKTLYSRNMANLFLNKPSLLEAIKYGESVARLSKGGGTHAALFGIPAYPGNGIINSAPFITLEGCKEVELVRSFLDISVCQINPPTGGSTNFRRWRCAPNMNVGYRYRTSDICWTSDIDFGNIGVILSQTAPHMRPSRLFRIFYTTVGYIICCSVR